MSYDELATSEMALSKVLVAVLLLCGCSLGLVWVGTVCMGRLYGTRVLRKFADLRVSLIVIYSVLCLLGKLSMLVSYN